MSVRYWAYFAAKVIVAGGILFGSLALLNPLAPDDYDSSAGEPAGSAVNPPATTVLKAAPPVLQSYPDNPKIAEEDATAAAGQGQAGSAAQNSAEIQVEIPEPSGREKTGGAESKSPEKGEEERALAPLYHGNQYLAINLALMVWFLFGAGMLYLIVYDQRYRCRVCLRRLRMPVETGSRGFMLQLGRPRTEYICPYGHGTLKQEEFQTSGLENPQWTSHSGDMWEELYAASKQAQDDEQ